ncbi:NADH:flavin oxidoreductase [Phenylobacterium sp. LjRoot225]|uniref:NADH:flavin oxidoreductase n=1 Tax=Phenylobacterium sp. LjRoot225 TaxID=3342285 RepID=UPI003ECD3B1D
MRNAAPSSSSADPAIRSPDATSVDPLLTPLQLRGCRLANRVVMAPMSRYMSPGGIPTPEVASYYARRAASGLGLIVTEGAAVAHPLAVDHPGVPRLHGEAALQGWKAVVEAVHAAGGVIWPQLWHQGPMWNVEHAGDDAMGGLRPSGVWGPDDGVISIPQETRSRALPETRAMTDSEIQEAVEAYALSARHAKALGFDGVAIHGAHGYLIDSFLWGVTNRRADRWGGGLRARAEFGCAVVRAIRREVGEEMPIALRLSQFKMQDYRAQIAASPDELEALLGPLADAGVDLFDASQRFFDTPIFEGSSLNLAGWAKALTGRPSMTVGGVGLGKAAGPAKHIDDSQASADNLPRVVERFERGEFDLVAVGRSVLNDADWFCKARAGEPFAPFDPANLQRLT